MRRMIRNVLLAASVLSLPIPAMAGQLAPIPLLGNWSGAAYDDDDTGTFMRCIASSPSRNGIDMGVTMERNREWSLSFGSQEWNWQPDEQISFSIRFDGKSRYSGSAFALDAHVVLFPMPTDLRLVTAFRSAYQMTITVAGKAYSFELDGTSRLMVSLNQCIETQLAIERRKPPVMAGTPRMLE